MVTRDRLKELKLRSPLFCGSVDSGTTSEDLFYVDVDLDNILALAESRRLVSEDQANPIHEFMERAERLRLSISRLEQCVADITEKHSTSLTIPHVDEALTGELNELAEEASQLTDTAKAELAAMEQETVQVAAASGVDGEQRASDGTLELRIRSAHTAALRRRLFDALRAYNAEQAAHRDRCRRRIAMYLHINSGDDAMEVEQEDDEAMSEQLDRLLTLE